MTLDILSNFLSLKFLIYKVARIDVDFFVRIQGYNHVTFLDHYHIRSKPQSVLGIITILLL